MAEVGQKSPLVKPSELFAGLPNSVYTSILSAAKPREFTRRQVIFGAGDPIKEILLLTHGRAKITLLKSCGDEVILRLHIPGEIIGPLGFEPGDVHSWTAQPLEPCRVLVWDAATFERLSEQFPVLRRNALCMVARRLCEIESRFCEISSEEVSPRLVHELIRLIGQMGYKVNGHAEIKVSQGALAQMTAMNLCTVNRVLAKWEHQGLVSLRRQAIVIRNYDGLLCLHG